jgi:hypothetical protein
LHGFATAPPIASSLSGAARKGKGLALTGDQPYRSLILPLTKALQHFTLIHGVDASLPESGGSWMAQLVIPVGIVDAPLVLAKTPEDRADISLVPWMRVLRRHPRTRRSSERSVTLVDVVHKDFFDEYLARYLTPFARVFRQRLCSVRRVVMSFDAVHIPGLDLESPPRNLYRALSARASSG